MSKLVKGEGLIQVSNGVRIITDTDICRYYRFLVGKRFPWIKTQIPSYGGHITICNPNVHGVSDFSYVEYLDGQRASFSIFPEKIYQSPKNFFIPAVAEIYHEIRYQLCLKERKDWLGLHLTVCNMKFND